MSRLTEVEAQLLAPGAPFALTEEEVFGERVRVFANRARSLRDILVRAREFSDADYMVFYDRNEERRYTFGEHEGLVAAAAAAFADRAWPRRLCPVPAGPRCGRPTRGAPGVGR